MVVGNFPATVTTYQRMLDEPSSQFKTTWRLVRSLFESIDPSRTFLTNAHIGLPNTTRTTAGFPITESFLRRCRRLLSIEIEILQPTTVVCLGRPAAVMVASVVDGLEQWDPWPGFDAMQDSSDQVVVGCEMNDTTLTAVAVRHPSAVLNRDARQRDAAAITAACG